MAKIAVKIVGRNARLISTERITSGSRGMLIRFEFDEEWNGISPLACFRGYDVRDQMLDAENTCEIPWECLVDYGEHLVVGVYGVNDDGKIIIPTIYCDVGLIYEGAEPTETTIQEATVSAVQQMLSAVGATVAKANEAEAYAHEASESATQARVDADEASRIANEVYTAYQNGDLKGEKGDTPVKGVDYFDGKDYDHSEEYQELHDRIERYNAEIESNRQSIDESVAEAQGYAESASASATHAEQIAINNGYAMMYTDDDGNLYLTRTSNIKDKINFSLSSTGELEVMING